MVPQVRARPLGANLGCKVRITNSMKSTTEPASLTRASYEELVREMIVRLGEDPDREGLTRTPERVAKAMQYLVKGYKEDPEALDEILHRLRNSLRSTRRRCNISSRATRRILKRFCAKPC